MSKPSFIFKLFFDAVISVIRSLVGSVPTKTNFWHYITPSGMDIKLRRFVSDSVVVIETWWLEEYGHYTQSLPRSPVVIDIGGHIGTFSLYLASRYPHSTIYAFEPNPQNHSLFTTNISQNRLNKTITLANLAVTSRTGQQLKLFTHTNNTGMNSLISPQDSRNFTTCSTISLSDIFQKNHLTHCDFLKMDCEGGEYDILLNSPAAVLQKIDRLVMEYHSGGDINQVFKRLQSVGFQVNRAGFFAAPLLVASRI